MHFSETPRAIAPGSPSVWLFAKSVPNAVASRHFVKVESSTLPLQVSYPENYERTKMFS